MARNRTVSPSSTGRKPKMQKMFDGRNMATRPIPLIVDNSEKLAIKVAASEQKPKTKAVNMPSGPRVGGVGDVFGTKVSGGSSASSKGGTFNPATGLGETI